MRGAAATSAAWPYAQARETLDRLVRLESEAERNGTPLSPTRTITFETGYGPSGLPHIGTFGEAARTSMVRQAFRELTDNERPTRMIVFSDDMDALRRVPDNVPRRDMLEANLGRPLTRIPDPFGTHESFGEHNNARLREFLDAHEFDYEFISASERYESGDFNDVLRVALRLHDRMREAILPSLGEARRKTYSPFIPLCPESGRALEAEALEIRLDADSVVWRHPENGRPFETSILNGAAKCQWKADWAMRWTALNVDYEMSGKDLIESVKLSGRLCSMLGGDPPAGFSYELFLDENGEKISKSRGNGLAIEEWLRYASPASLRAFMYHQPRRAKRLHVEAIPRAVDDYLAHAEAYRKQTPDQHAANPARHAHGGEPPVRELPLGYSMLVNLAAASNSSDADTLWGFIRRYAPSASPETMPILADLTEGAAAYFRDRVAPTRSPRAPDDDEKQALIRLNDALKRLPDDADAETIQNAAYDVGRTLNRDMRQWFQALYEILLGASSGPRFGSFAQLYGLNAARDLIADAVKRAS